MQWNLSNTLHPKVEYVEWPPHFLRTVVLCSILQLCRCDFGVTSLCCLRRDLKIRTNVVERDGHVQLSFRFGVAYAYLPPVVVYTCGQVTFCKSRGLSPVLVFVMPKHWLTS